jgi:rRNA maturation endonuclease Nob1
MSLIEKIDAEIEYYEHLAVIYAEKGMKEDYNQYNDMSRGAKRIKEIILSEQKEPCIPDYDSYAFACKNCHTILGNLYICEEPKFCHECGNPISWKFNIEDGVIIKTEKAD